MSALSVVTAQAAATVITCKNCKKEFDCKECQGKSKHPIVSLPKRCKDCVRIAIMELTSQLQSEPSMPSVRIQAPTEISIK